MIVPHITCPTLAAFLILLSLAVYILLLSSGFLLLIGVLAYVLHHLKTVESNAREDEGTVSYFEDPNSLKKVQCPSIFDPSKKYLSLIVPAYNEETRMPVAVEEMLNYLQQRSVANKSFSYEVLIVDDGSTDGTARVAYDLIRKYSVDNIRLIRLGANYGKGAATRKGMVHSRGELLLMLDADGATRISDLEKLEAKILEVGGKELAIKSKSGSSNLANIGDIPVAVFGSRAHLEKHALATRKWYRNLLMKGFHLCVLLVAGGGVKDTQCGFKMFTRSAARQLFKNLRLRRWCFDVELVYLCKVLNIPIYEIAVTWTEIPGSKVRITSIVHMLLEMACIRLGYGLRVWKIYE